LFPSPAAKLPGEFFGTFDGLTISVQTLRAKKMGRDRLWIQIRQNDRPKRWRVSASLSYARSADIQFEEAPEE
jgi:hypothetical protein